MSKAVGPIACVACLVGAWLEQGCAPRVQATELTSAEISMRLADEAAGAVRGGGAERALSLAERAIAVSPASAWAHYDRAVALQELGRADAAVESYRQAERLFGTGDVKGKSIAIYGRARALADAGRCAEAHVAYQEYADFVRLFDPRASDLALEYAKDCRDTAPVLGDRVASDVASAVLRADYKGALEIAEEESAVSRRSPWLDYNRGVALGELGRTDEAVAAFVAAERGFGEDEANRHGRAVSIYGRARVLEKAGRCPEARRACEQYATFAGDDGERCRRC